MSEFKCPCGASRFRTVNKRLGIYRCRVCGREITRGPKGGIAKSVKTGLKEFTGAKG